MKNHSVIIQSIVTEKSSAQQSKAQYTFMVDKKATKIDIKKAIKEVYGVEAQSVQIMITTSKVRILKGKHEWTKRPSFKKAIVRIENGKTIDPNKIGSGAAKGAKAPKTEKEEKPKKEVKKKTVKKAEKSDKQDK